MESYCVLTVKIQTVQKKIESKKLSVSGGCCCLSQNVPQKEGCAVPCPCGWATEDPRSFVCEDSSTGSLPCLLTREWRNGSCSLVNAGWGELLPALFVEHLQVLS